MLRKGDRFEFLDHKHKECRSYTLIKKLGCGGFGSVFEAACEPNKIGVPSVVAIKFEKEKKNRTLQIFYEYKVYRDLHKYVMPERQNRFAKVYDFFKKDDQQKISAMVIEKMGINLQELFNTRRLDVEEGIRDTPFTNKEIFLVADQALDCINAVHDCGFVHRDIKPDNFCVRDKNSNELCIIDFGLSKRFMTGGGEHIPLRYDKGLMGTPRFASMRCHKGFQLSRRDDLESFLYMTLYFARPRLPWQKIEHPNKKKRYALIARKKKTTSTDETLFDCVPDGFKELFNYVHGLAFDEDPDYTKIRGMLLRIFRA